MAFETFLTVDKLKPRKGRRLTFLISLAVHGLVLAVGVAMSFAGVDELAPKNGTLVHIGSLPVPPPPPAGKKQKNKTKPKTAIKTPRRDNPLVLPQEKTNPEKPVDDDDGDDPDGDESGVKGSRGVGPGTAPEPVNLPPNVSKQTLAINPQDAPHRPRLPRALPAGMSVWALLRVCADRDGNVVEVKVLHSPDPSVNESFIAAVRTWRYTPFKLNGRPVPFCTNVRLDVQSTH